jgi:hypothetical protein
MSVTGRFPLVSIFNGHRYSPRHKKIPGFWVFCGHECPLHAAKSQKLALMDTDVHPGPEWL